MQLSCSLHQAFSPASKSGMSMHMRRQLFSGYSSLMTEASSFYLALN
jgi:hypothetical protein